MADIMQEKNWGVWKERLKSADWRMERERERERERFKLILMIINQFLANYYLQGFLAIFYVPGERASQARCRGR